METHYFLRQPETLERMAMVKLGDWIALQAEKSPISSSYIFELYQHDAIKAEKLLSRQIEIVRTFLDHNLPDLFYNNLVFETIRALSELLYRYKWLPKNNSSLSIKRKMNDDDKGDDDKSDDDKSDDDKGDDEWPLCKSPNLSYVIGRMVETVFTKSLTCLSLNNNAMDMAFYSKSYMLTGLTRLSLTQSWCDEETEAKIIQSIKGLHSLTYLLIKDTTDNILKCINNNCTLIEELNISHSSNINDKSIEILTQLPNLRIIHLVDTDVTQDGIKTLLTSCENIENIVIFHDSIAGALENIVHSEEYAGKQFKLKSFNMDCDLVTLKQLQIVVQTCPQIQKMLILKDPDQSFPSLALKGLQDLRDLELEGCDFYADQVEKLLEIGGRKLVRLNLDSVERMDINAFICINNSCPNLESLIISDCTIVHQTSVIHGLFHCKLTESPTKPFENLKTLSLHVKDLEIEPDQLLLYLLSNCPIIEFLYTTLPITDGIMLNVLNKNPLIYLKEWVMCGNKLTRTVIDGIVQNCIVPPKIHSYGGH